MMEEVIRFSKLIFLISVLLVSSAKIGYSQGGSRRIVPFYKRKNMASYSFDYGGPVLTEKSIGYYSIRINYGRRIWDKSNWIFSSGWGGIEAGFWGTLTDDGGTILVGGITCLTGSGNSHFEAKLSCIALFSSYSTSGKPGNTIREIYFISPGINFGYVYFNPESRFTIRIGTGIPEIIYVGGITFF